MAKAQSIRDLMTTNVTCVDRSSTVAEAAKMMEQADIGDVLVTDGDQMCGILTDRDIVVRAIAKGKDPMSTKVGEICSEDLVTLDPTSTLEQAKKLMADRAVRRLPVLEDGKPVGIVSLGDVAIESSGERPLEKISAASPNS